MNHTSKLRKLRQAAAQEGNTAREAQRHAEAEQQAAAAARDQLVEAHAAGSDVRKAEQAHGKARDKAEAAAIRAEGATRRAERAGQDADTYEREHVQDLLAELEPQASAAAERLAASARELFEAHTEWHDVSAKVGSLLRHVPGPSSAPSDHALAPVMRDVRNFLRTSGEIAPPLPRERATRNNGAADNYLPVGEPSSFIGTSS